MGLNRGIDRAIEAIPQPAWKLIAFACAMVILYVGSRSSSQIPSLRVLPPGSDKVLHFLAYAGMATCVFRAIYPLPASQSPIGSLPWWPIVFWPIVVGSLDEYFQGFAQGRSQDPKDLLADALGGVVVCLVALYWRERVRRRDRARAGAGTSLR